MSNSDKKIIKQLWAKGFVVVVKNVDGETFPQRYNVYQNCYLVNMKLVVVDKNGKPTTLQG